MKFFGMYVLLIGALASFAAFRSGTPVHPLIMVALGTITGIGLLMVIL